MAEIDTAKTKNLKQQAHAPVVANAVPARAQNQRVVLVSDGDQERAGRGHGHQERIRRDVQRLRHLDAHGRRDDDGRRVVQHIRQRHCHDHQQGKGGYVVHECRQHATNGAMMAMNATRSYLNRPHSNMPKTDPNRVNRMI
jgi:hypothetical protein